MFCTNIVLLKLLQFQCQINWKYFNEFPAVLSPLPSHHPQLAGHWTLSLFLANNQWPLHQTTSANKRAGIVTLLTNQKPRNWGLMLLIISEWCSSSWHWEQHRDSSTLKYEILCHHCVQCIVPSSLSHAPGLESAQNSCNLCLVKSSLCVRPG